MFKIKLSIIILAIALTIAVPVVEAGQIKITDQRGLTRAVRKVDNKARVLIKVQLSQGEPVELVLSNVDGMGGEVSAKSNQQGQLLFENIGDGTWEIRAGNQVIVSEVKIAD